MSFFLAVDGGGTKTQFVLFDSRSGSIDTRTLGATNHELLPGGFDQMRGDLRGMFESVLSEKGLDRDEILFSVWGMSGLDTKSQYGIIHGFITDMGISRFFLCNDSDLAIKAALPEGYGVSLVNGTGYNVVGINESGERYQIGAHFELTGDYGGGMVLGRLAIKTTYMNLFRYRRETILSRLVMGLYEVDSRHDFIDRVTQWANTKKFPIPGAAKCVFEAANLGDEESVAILERMADEYALCVKSLLEELPFSGTVVNVVLVGSLFTKNLSDIHLKALEENLKRYIPDKSFALHILELPPVAGALAWALERGGISDPWAKAVACFDGGQANKDNHKSMSL